MFGNKLRRGEEEGGSIKAVNMLNSWMVKATYFLNYEILQCVL